MLKFQNSTSNGLKDMTIFSWKWTLKNAMKNEKNLMDTLWGIWAQCLCTLNSLGCVLLLVFGSENHSWTDHFRGPAPSISEQLNFIENHFHFQAKIGKPKNELFGVDKCLVIELFLPWTVFCYSPLARGFILNLHFKRASPRPSVFKIELITWWGISSTAPTMVS